jgi:hypothetical protein
LNQDNSFCRSKKKKATEVAFCVTLIVGRVDQAMLMEESR